MVPDVVALLGEVRELRVKNRELAVRKRRLEVAAVAAASRERRLRAVPMRVGELVGGVSTGADRRAGMEWALGRVVELMGDVR